MHVRRERQSFVFFFLFSRECRSVVCVCVCLSSRAGKGLPFSLLANNLRPTSGSVKQRARVKRFAIIAARQFRDNQAKSGIQLVQFHRVRFGMTVRAKRTRASPTRFALHLVLRDRAKIRQTVRNKRTNFFSVVDDDFRRTQRSRCPLVRARRAHSNVSEAID